MQKIDVLGDAPKITEIILVDPPAPEGSGVAEQAPGRVVTVRNHADLPSSLSEISEALDLALEGDGPTFVDLRHWRAYLRDLEVRAREMTKHSASNRLIFAQAIHDIRGALSVIRKCTELVLKSESICRRTTLLVLQIVKSTESLDGLLEEILTLFQCDVGSLRLNLTAVPIRAELESLLGAYDLQCREKGLHFVTRFSGSLPEYVTTDSLKLRRVVGNVVANAVKFTEWGKIEVEISHEDNRLVIRVSDTGSGVPSELRPVVFEPFQQQAGFPQLQGGSGLGLSVARRLARAMGGDAVLESSSRETGSVFRLFWKAEVAGRPL